MSWHGIGLVSRSWAPPLKHGLLGVIPTGLAPSALWIGQPGSGFAALPVDPPRITAKPALRLLTPPYQRFSDTLDVAAIAMANERGTLINNFGIADVQFHFEGNSVTVVRPFWHTIMTARGPRTYFGWWVRLRKPTMKSGLGHLFIEARARDATMQPRVIGPFAFSPVSQRYDAAVTVDPDMPEVADVNYRTLAAAMARAKQSDWVNPLITIAKPGIYSSAGTDGAAAWALPGYVNITASVPGVILGYPDAPTFANPQSLFGTNRMKLHVFGPNITVDFANFSALARDGSGAGFEHWMDGVTITNSLGRNSFFRGTTRGGVNRVNGNPWFTECEVSNLDQAANGASLVRGCSFSDTYGDMLNGANVIQSQANGHGGRYFNDNEPMFTVQYTGPEAIATIARRGGLLGTANADGVGMYRVVIGATTHDFVVGDSSVNYWNGSLGQGFWFSDVVAWLNTIPGVTATLLTDQDRSAGTGCLGPELSSETNFGTLGRGWGFPANGTSTPLDIKAAPRIIRSFFDLHADWFQHGSGTMENRILWGNVARNITGQILFLSPVGSGIVQRDIFVVGNSFHRITDPEADERIGSASQWWIRNSSAQISHVVIAHNSWAGQRMALRSDFPAVSVGPYSLFANNVAPRITVQATSFDAATVTCNHIRGDEPPPTVGSDWTTGGTSSADFYVNAPEGDFRATGTLKQYMSAPRIHFDRNRLEFGISSPLGSVAE